MAITFDPRKEDETFAERGLRFADAGIVFAGRTHSFEDNRRDYGEVRIITIGFLDGRMTVVGWVPRGEDR